MNDKTVLTVEIDGELQETIAEKIRQEMSERYYWGIANTISEALESKLKENGYIDRVADLILAKVKMDESTYVQKITEKLTETMLETVGTISKEVLEKVSKKVKEYGFIQIGR